MRRRSGVASARWPKRTPTRHAIVFAPVEGPERHITWRELDAEACRVGRLLEQRGVDQTSIVVVGLRNSPEHFFVSIAAWKLGACVLHSATTSPRGSATASSRSPTRMWSWPIGTVSSCRCSFARPGGRERAVAGALRPTGCRTRRTRSRRPEPRAGRRSSSRRARACTTGNTGAPSWPSTCTPMPVRSSSSRHRCTTPTGSASATLRSSTTR